MKKPSLTVIFPCHHESLTIIKNGIEQVKQLTHNTGWTVSFIVAQNGDDFPFVISDPAVTVKFIPQKSFGHAISQSLQTVKSDWFYIISPDIPFKLKDLKAMLARAYITESPDLMIGSKLHPHSTYIISPLRRLMTAVFSTITKIIFSDFPVADPNGSLFGRVHGFRTIFSMLTRTSFSVSVELIWLYHRQGAQILELPVTYKKPSRSGTSIHIIQDSLTYAFDLLSIRLKTDKDQLMKKYRPSLIKPTSKSMGLALLLSSFAGIYYLLPLLQPYHNVAGGVGDSLTHASATTWFCDNFFRQEFHNPLLYAPKGVSMQASYDMPLLQTLVCPLRPFGPIVMWNTLAIIQFLLILATAFIVACHFITRKALRITYILLSSFSSFYMVRYQVHLNLLSVIWGTQLLLYMWWTLKLYSFKSVLFTALSTAIVFTSGWQNIPLLTPLILVLGIRALVRYFEVYKLNLSFSKNVIIGLVGFGILFIPFAYPISTAPQNTDIDNYLNQSLYVYSADAASYLLPAQTHRLLGEPLSSLYNKVTAPRGISYKEFTVAPDILVLLLFFPSSYYLLKRRTRIIKPLLLIIALQIILSFGPQLTILGTKIMDLPYYETLWQYYPFKANRTPARYGAPALILITLITLIGIDRYLKSKTPKQSQQLSTILLIYPLIASFFLYPNTTFSFLNYPPQLPLKGLEIIKNDPKLSYVLNIPLAVMEDPSQNFLQSFHQKALIAGYASYLAVDTQTLQFIETSPTLSKLSCANQRIQNPIFPGEIFEPAYFSYLDNPHLFVKELQQKNIDYIIFHTDLISNFWCQDLTDIKKRLDTNPHIKIIDTSPVFTVYQIEPIQTLIDEHAATIEPYTYFYFGPGWYPPYEDPKVRSLIRDVGDIFIEVDTDKTVTVTLEFDPPLQRKVEMYQEGKLYGVHDVESTLEFEFPATKGKNTLGLKYYPCDQQSLSNPGCVPFWVSALEVK